jgi:NAD(P)-dependent dehydrogenase (short-subunit alcohol dehydrogenase family)
MALPPLYYAVGILVAAGGYWLWRTFFVNGVPCTSKVRLDGKTVIITGGNAGIGKETAVDLARRGGRIILACRSVERGEKAVADVRERSGSDNVRFRQLDLASCKSIRAFANRILSEELEIHVLINNAGVMFVPYTLTEDGFETHFGVNHLGHFLLTNLLLERIKESAPSRIVNVSSLAHVAGNLDFEDMMWKKRYQSQLAYCRSKLANVMFSRELAKRIAGSGVTVCSLHPGTIHTELTRYFFSGYLLPLKPFAHVAMWLFTKSAWQGAQTTLHCATANEVEGISGKYWDNCRIQKHSSRARDDEACRKLWEYSANLVGVDP